MPKAITPSVINEMFVGFNTLFNKAYAAQPTPILDALAMTTNSSSDSEVYGWMKEIPGFREWKGDRIIKSLDSNGYQIYNTRYEDSFAINRDQIKDDKFGVFNPLVSQIATNGKLDPEYRIVDHLIDGWSKTAYDSVALFGTHTWKGNTSVINHFSEALSRESFISAVEQLTVIVGSKGTKGEQPLMVNPTFNLIVSPSNYIEALEIVKAATIDTGGTNVLQGMANVLQSALLGATGGSAGATNATNYWFLSVSNSPGGIRPLVYQVREGMETTQLLSNTDTNVFMRNEFQWGASMRYGYGYGFWQLIFGSNAAAS